MENQTLDQPFIDLVKADKWKRFGAIFIDGIVAYIPYIILIMISNTAILLTLGYLVALAYYLVRDGLFDGRSFGKKILGLKVVRTTDGSSIAGDFGKSATRNISLFIPFIDAILVLMDKDRLGDGWAGTMVVEG